MEFKFRGYTVSTVSPINVLNFEVSLRVNPPEGGLALGSPKLIDEMLRNNLASAAKEGRPRFLGTVRTGRWIGVEVEEGDVRGVKADSVSYAGYVALGEMAEVRRAFVVLASYMANYVQAKDGFAVLGNQYWELTGGE